MGKRVSCAECSSPVEESSVEAHLRSELGLPGWRCLVCRVHFSDFAAAVAHNRPPFRRHSAEARIEEIFDAEGSRRLAKLIGESLGRPEEAAPAPTGPELLSNPSPHPPSSRLLAPPIGAPLGEPKADPEVQLSDDEPDATDPLSSLFAKELEDQRYSPSDTPTEAEAPLNGSQRFETVNLDELSAIAEASGPSSSPSELSAKAVPETARRSPSPAEEEAESEAETEALLMDANGLVDEDDIPSVCKKTVHGTCTFTSHRYGGMRRTEYVEMERYLRTKAFPARLASDQTQILAFRNRARKFTLKDGRLYSNGRANKVGSRPSRRVLLRGEVRAALSDAHGPKHRSNLLILKALAEEQGVAWRRMSHDAWVFMRDCLDCKQRQGTRLSRLQHCIQEKIQWHQQNP